MIKGKAHKYGSDIDTDVIIPARYCTSFRAEDLGPHCLEDLDPEFVRKVRAGDILVAEDNFGCGSSRENAPIAIKAAGISCVVARSFARIFYRNAINIGLPILESPECVGVTESGDDMEIDLSSGRIVNLTRRKTCVMNAFPPLIQEIIDAGGMESYVKMRLRR